MAPTLQQTRSAVTGITSMPDAVFKRRKTGEAGDTLVAFLVILAKKLFPHDAEALNARRVELMLASYFLRGELDRLPAVPPDEKTARAAVDRVASLPAGQLDLRITAEVGDAVLAFCSAFAQKVLPETDAERRAKNVQLMVLSYLLRADLTTHVPS